MFLVLSRGRLCWAAGSGSWNLILDTGSHLYLVTVAACCPPQHRLGTPRPQQLEIGGNLGWSCAAQHHNHHRHFWFWDLSHLLLCRFSILISPETRTVYQCQDAACSWSEYDVPWDLEQKIHQIPETSQPLQCILADHINHSDLLLSGAHELLPHHEGD